MLSYLPCVFFMTRILDGTINFKHVTFTATFDLHLDNFNSPQNFLTIRHRTFIFGVCVSFINTFLNAVCKSLREPKVLYI